MTNIAFVNNVLKIAAQNPTYRTGGTGADGTCDCIGLVMGALGKEYPMHSTNYFARYEMFGLGELSGNEHRLALGDLVYKARNEDDPSWNLNVRYQSPLGRYYTGDMLDYYHVGVVTSLVPLEITHCTSTGSVNGITKDTSLRAWTHFGQIKDVPLVVEEEEPEAAEEAAQMVVTAPNGKPVNVRKYPSLSALKVGELDVGTGVLVHEQADGWARIASGELKGYMVADFLEDPQATEGRMVTVELSESAARKLMEALRKSLV